ncbi:hypothetical protein [Arsukibacterium sp.]|uniref:hypothetical protein n=1 Tax=Arsukibacterium sp. TaxID=1977258 RepID=UPI002FDADA12
MRELNNCCSMTDHKQNPAEIYLVPDAEHGHVWSDDPAPGEGMREENATRYVREDLVPESNATLALRIAELTRENSTLQARCADLELLLSTEQDLVLDYHATNDALAAQVELLKAAITTALRGTVFDEVGNRDDDGLIPFRNTKTAIEVLTDALCQLSKLRQQAKGGK